MQNKEEGISKDDIQTQLSMSTKKLSMDISGVSDPRNLDLSPVVIRELLLEQVEIITKANEHSIN